MQVFRPCGQVFLKRIVVNVNSLKDWRNIWSWREGSNFRSAAYKTLGYREGGRRSARWAFGAGHHAAEGAGAGGGGLAAGGAGL